MCVNPEKPLRTVQLRHTLPDGSDHIDWLIARDSAASLPLATWRLARRVDELEPRETVSLTRLADHRTLYLDYEGPITGDRGCVLRIATGSVIRASKEPTSDGETQEIDVEWQKLAATFTQSLSLTRLTEENWIVTCTQRSD